MIPRHLEIDCLDWEVKTAELNHEQHGECRDEECQMLIANRLTEQMKEVTFWHEFIHMISRSRDLDWSELLKGNKEDPEEVIAKNLGPAIYAFIKTNCNLEWKDSCCAY